MTIHCSIRASTLKQEASPDVQRAQINAYCDTQEWRGEPRLFYVDKATTSKIPFLQRDAGGQLHQALKQGDRVVLTKMDRGFRNTREFLSVMEDWSRIGVHVHIINFMGGNAIDFSSPVGKFCLTILAAASEFERATLAERTRETMRYLKQQGMIAGQPRLGFITTYRTVNGVRRRFDVMDPEERKQMRLIVRMRTDDPPYSWDEIRNELNYVRKWHRTKKWGEHRSGREWSIASIQRACRAEMILQFREANSYSKGREVRSQSKETFSEQ